MLYVVIRQLMSTTHGQQATVPSASFHCSDAPPVNCCCLIVCLGQFLIWFCVLSIKSNQILQLLFLTRYSQSESTRSFSTTSSGLPSNSNDSYSVSARVSRSCIVLTVSLSPITLLLNVDLVAPLNSQTPH